MCKDDLYCFCKMCVVLCAVNLYIFVFMTCSTSCCIYDTLMDPQKVCICVCVCVYVLCMYEYVCMHACLYLYMYYVYCIYIYITHMCMYTVYIYIYIYRCVCIYMYMCIYIYTYIYIYRVSQEECARLREGVPYVKVYRYNPKHLCPKLNGYGDNGQRSLKL